MTGYSYYDPNLAWHPDEPFYAPTSAWAMSYAPASEWDDVVGAAGGGAASLGTTGGAPATAQDFFSQLGRGIEHGFGELFSHAPDVVRAPSNISTTVDKAGRAADIVSARADAMSEDTRRAMAAAEDTAKAIKYVVYGVGGLAAVALVFSILKSAID